MGQLDRFLVSVIQMYPSVAFLQHVPNQPKEGEPGRESDIVLGGRNPSPFHTLPPCSLDDAPDVIKLPAPGRMSSINMNMYAATRGAVWSSFWVFTKKRMKNLCNEPEDKKKKCLWIVSVVQNLQSFYANVMYISLISLQWWTVLIYLPVSVDCSCMRPVGCQFGYRASFNSQRVATLSAYLPCIRCISLLQGGVLHT